MYHTKFLKHKIVFIDFMNLKDMRVTGTLKRSNINRTVQVLLFNLTDVFYIFKREDLCQNREGAGGFKTEPTTQKSQTHLPGNGQGQRSHRLRRARFQSQVSELLLDLGLLLHYLLTLNLSLTSCIFVSFKP